MSAQQEEKINKLVEFALEFKNDPDFNRLVFPPVVMARLAELGVEVKPRTYTASQAVDRCIGMTSSERYTTTDVAVIDQTSLECSFPPIPPLASPIDTNETKTPESADCPNPLERDAVLSISDAVLNHESSENQAPPPDQMKPA
jgi:hypothetical protein